MTINRLIFLITAKLRRIFFESRHRSQFKSLGRAAYLFSPFRIEGDGIEIGTASVLQRGAWLYCKGIDDIPASLKIGIGCVFGYNNHITSVREVTIGDYVLTANNVYISDNIHGYEDINSPIMYQQVRVKQPVVIGSGSWIGENVSIIGAKIGKNCVIGANAVVTKDIPDYSVAVGIPAIVIKQYDTKAKQWLAVHQPSN